MRRNRFSWLLAGAFSLAVVAAYIVLASIDAGYDIEITAPTLMYSTERDARCEYRCGPPIARPIQALRPGERLAVVNDAYGRDYWAFRVRTNAGKEGWVVYRSGHVRVLKPDA
jgi:hypothetical protein